MSLLALRVDTREPKQMHNLFYKAFGNRYGRAELNAGDISAITDAGLVLFERKTGADLLSSIKDNRLMSQSARMVDATNRAYLLVTSPIIPDINTGRAVFGLHGEWHVGGFSYAAVQGALLAIQEIGVFVLHCTDHNLPKIVETICDRAGGKIRVNPNLKLVEAKPPVEIFYMALPGIGSKLAEKLAEMFPVLVAGLWALTDIENFPDLGISGLGHGKRAKIREFMGGIVTPAP